MPTVEQVNNDLQDVKIQVGVHEQRLDNAEAEIKQLQTENRAIYEINTNVRLLAENMNTVKNDVADVKEGVKEVKTKNSQLRETLDAELDAVKTEINDVRNQPSKSKAAIYDKVAWAIGGGVLAFLLELLLSQLFK